MADYALGAPATVALRLTDSNGTPVTSGVTGTFTLYGPASATATSGPTALAHLGDGAWGVTFPATAMTATGVYRAVTGSVTYGSSTLGAQTVVFTVGVPSPVHKTLRECLVALYDELHDGLPGTTSSLGTTTTAVDSRRVNTNLTADEYVDSELLLLAPGSVTDANPLVVTSFTPASGTFTFAPAVTAVASGTPYLLCNLRGQGYPVRDVRAKILAAWREIMPRQQVIDTVSVATDGTYELAIPANWRDVDMVGLRNASTQPWGALAPAYWEWDAPRRLLRFAHQHAAGLAVRLEGTIDYAEPAFLNSVVQVPFGWLRDRVLGELLAGSRDRGLQQRAAVHLRRAEQRMPR